MLAESGGIGVVLFLIMIGVAIWMQRKHNQSVKEKQEEVRKVKEEVEAEEETKKPKWEMGKKALKYGIDKAIDYGINRVFLKR